MRRGGYASLRLLLTKKHEQSRMASKQGFLLVVLLCMIPLMAILIFISQVRELMPFFDFVLAAHSTPASTSSSTTAATISTSKNTPRTASRDHHRPYHNVSLHSTGITRSTDHGSTTLDHDSRNQASSDTKFLQYFVQEGFGNQIGCLDSAYFIAWATNRTLILPPIVPHHHLHYRDVLNMDHTHTFHVDYDLRKAYLTKLKTELYLRVDMAMDIESTLPLVSTVDFRDFYQNIYPSLSRWDSWVVESEYHHFNTRWVVGQPELEGLSDTTIVTVEQGRKVNNTVVVRDLWSVGRAMKDYAIWTLLDSFYAFSPRNYSFATRIRPRQATVDKPRLCKWFRHAARHILHQYSWGGIPYASVHIRGSDGPFKKPEAVADAIRYGMDSISSLVREWASKNYGSNYTRIGVFVATDLGYLDSKDLFTKRAASLNDTLFTTYGTTLEILFSKDIQRKLQDLNRTDDNFPYADLVTPGLFLDQQIAACASIGFVKAKGSSFSNFIMKLRNDAAENVCQ